MHISPSIESPCASRQRATKAAASSGAMPAFCGSSPVLTCTKSVGRRPCRAISLASAAGEPVAVERVDRVEERHRLARLVGLQRADQMQAKIGIARAKRRPLAFRLLHAVLAELPLPGGEHRLDRAASKVFETAMSVIAAGSRPARAAAAAIRALTSASLLRPHPPSRPSRSRRG